MVRKISTGILKCVICALVTAAFFAGCQDGSSGASPPISSVSSNRPTVSPGRVNIPEPTPIPTPEPTPEPIVIVPAADKQIPDGFFSDAAFIGNSLVEGFRMYAGFNDSYFYSATSLSVFGLGSAQFALPDGGSGTVYQGLAQRPYGKVYILLELMQVSTTDSPERPQPASRGFAFCDPPAVGFPLTGSTHTKAEPPRRRWKQQSLTCLILTFRRFIGFSIDTP